MDGLLSKLSSGDVRREPFPHLTAAKVLEESLVDRLISEFPSPDVIVPSRKNGSNQRFGLASGLALKSPAVSPLWKEFVARHTSQEFWRDCVRVFRPAVSEVFPDLEKKLGCLDQLKVGIRKIDTFATADVLLNLSIAINTPVTTVPSAVRGAHVDHPRKLLVGLFYLRPPQDVSRGGDLELYTFDKSSRLRFEGHDLKSKRVDCVASVPYEPNRMLFFVNSLRSLHGVSVREGTAHPRIFVQFTAAFKEPIFDLHPYSQGPFERLWSNWFKNPSTPAEPSGY